MTSFAVCYDLINETSGYDYQPLWNEFARLKAQKTQYSMYLVNLNNTAKDVVEHFKRFVDSNDRIWALEVTKNHHYVNAISGTNAWLEKNPPIR